LTGKQCKKNATIGELCSTHGPKVLNECGICLEESVKTSKYNVELECKHIFCKECIFRWINTTSNCPKCRKEVSDYELMRARLWGESEGIVYRAQIKIYKLNRLPEFDSLFLAMIMDIHRETSYSDTEFKKLEDYFSKNTIYAKNFKNMTDIGYSVPLWIKTDTLIGNPKIIHTILP